MGIDSPMEKELSFIKIREKRPLLHQRALPVWREGNVRNTQTPGALVQGPHPSYQGFFPQLQRPPDGGAEAERKIIWELVGAARRRWPSWPGAP